MKFRITLPAAKPQWPRPAMRAGHWATVPKNSRGGRGDPDELANLARGHLEARHQFTKGDGGEMRDARSGAVASLLHAAQTLRALSISALNCAELARSSTIQRCRISVAIIVPAARRVMPRRRRSRTALKASIALARTLGEAAGLGAIPREARMVGLRAEDVAGQFQGVARRHVTALHRRAEGCGPRRIAGGAQGRGPLSGEAGVLRPPTMSQPRPGLFLPRAPNSMNRSL